MAEGPGHMDGRAPFGWLPVRGLLGEQICLCPSAAWGGPGSGWGAFSTKRWATDQDSWSTGLGFHLSYATRPVCDLGEVPYPSKPAGDSPAECGQSESHPTGLSWGSEELTDCKRFPWGLPLAGA